ncbi:hypothetical protein B0H10DRAFT_369063 [Mycena sp. CBHHK59/15]|nr:hypothetical protein B0H10DRAFT_369063 [Mycena sp. CBHHK59/15]
MRDDSRLEAAIPATPPLFLVSARSARLKQCLPHWAKSGGPVIAVKTAPMAHTIARPTGGASTHSALPTFRVTLRLPGTYH